MFNKKLQNFLNANKACLGGTTRLQDIKAETLEQAWEKASDEDLIWAVTRTGVMNPEQCRLFLIMVLESVEDKLTDPRSLNILTKLRTNEIITDEDRAAARAAASDVMAASDASDEWAASWDAARAASAARVAKAAVWDAVRAAVWAAWVRENFKPCNLCTK